MSLTCSEVGAIAGYLSAASNTMVVGHLLGLLTQDIMTAFESSQVKTMCIGHSLGSHICGFTGKTTQLDVIIGLDPAGPIFEDNSPNNRLNRGDAKVVYAIHVNAAVLGIYKTIGDYDIYLNGGRNQPDCGANFVCSHITFSVGFLDRIWTEVANGGTKCIFGMLAPDLGEPVPLLHSRQDNIRGVVTNGTPVGCEFTIDNIPAGVTRKLSDSSSMFKLLFGANGGVQ